MTDPAADPTPGSGPSPGSGPRPGAGADANLVSSDATAPVHARQSASDPTSDSAQRAADLTLLIEAAQQAGHIATGFWRRDPEVWAKSDASPVSEADLAVNDMLAEHLRAARPDYGWLSEETPDEDPQQHPDGPARLGHDRVFIVDPIDGTRAFVDGQKTWAHALAVAEAGRIIAGVVFLPLRDELYAATLGGGAVLNDAVLAVSTRAQLDGAEVLANKHALDARHWPGGVPQVTRHTRPALAHRLALVAEGRFDASLSFGRVWEWDSAAGSLLVSEAGGTVTDRHGAPLRFNQPEPRAPGVLAATPGVHADIAGEAG